MSARIAVLQTAREDGIENGAGDYTQLSFAGDCSARRQFDTPTPMPP